jgi:hypothetical protein
MANDLLYKARLHLEASPQNERSSLLYKIQTVGNRQHRTPALNRAITQLWAGARTPPQRCSKVLRYSTSAAICGAIPRGKRLVVVWQVSHSLIHIVNSCAACLVHPQASLHRAPMLHRRFRCPSRTPSARQRRPAGVSQKCDQSRTVRVEVGDVFLCCVCYLPVAVAEKLEPGTVVEHSFQH